MDARTNSGSLNIVKLIPATVKIGQDRSFDIMRAGVSVVNSWHAAIVGPQPSVWYFADAIRSPTAVYTRVAHDPY